MSQNFLKFWDKFETKLRTDLRPYRENLETYLTIILLRANWDIFETWVHSDIVSIYILTRVLRDNYCINLQNAFCNTTFVFLTPVIGTMQIYKMA